jgi:type IV secretion system protein VirB9
VLVLGLCALGACTTFRPPQISYDDELPPPLPESAALVQALPRPLHVPPAWAPARGGKKEEAKEPIERIESANSAARIEPRRGGYFNAVQVFPYSPGALYQIYAAPGQITDIALEPGEQLVGSGSLSAGDTIRWVVADTESGSGDSHRVHIMVKPTRPAIETNLVVNTDRRTYLIELRSREKPYMPSVAWFYPEEQAGAVTATSLKAIRLLGDPSTPTTMAARSTSSSRQASRRVRCPRCLSSELMARPKW